MTQMKKERKNDNLWIEREKERKRNQKEERTKFNPDLIPDPNPLWAHTHPHNTTRRRQNKQTNDPQNNRSRSLPPLSPRHSRELLITSSSHNPKPRGCRNLKHLIRRTSIPRRQHRPRRRTRPTRHHRPSSRMRSSMIQRPQPTST